MTNRTSRLYIQTVKYSVTCMTISLFLLFSISFTTQNHSLFNLNLFQTPYEDGLLFINQSSSSTYHTERTKFYPYLPIQIYTENRERFLQLQNKTKKIILLANPWFDDPTWSLSLKNKTNSGNMSELRCSFLNNQCEITSDINRFKQADAIVYHMRNSINRSTKIIKYRHPSQRFVFTLWESPCNTDDLHSYNLFFNWTMTYRFDSHIFASYYHPAAYHSKDNQWLKNITYDYQSNEDKLVLYENINITQKLGTAAALISNCGGATKKRWALIMELKKYIDVTVYGSCGQPCPISNTEEKIDCRAYIAEHYYFLLAFENSLCQDYTTEKFFSAIILPAIPVVYGRVDYTRFIPQSGFIDVRQFSSIAELGIRLNQIRNNVTLYQEYFQWKRQFLWGGFSTFMTPFCDLCLRLHLDTTPNIITDIHKWWNDKKCE